MNRLDRRIDLLACLGLLALALLFRLAVRAAFPFDGLYGQDAYAYYDYAAGLRIDLLHGRPPAPFFWPLGYPLHVAAMMIVLGEQPMAGQVISLLTGASIAPLAFLVAREAVRSSSLARVPSQGVLAGLVAGLIVAVGGQLTISSLSIMSDAVGLAWATASAWLVLRYARTQRPTDLLLAVCTWSVATITRWIFGLLALPWGLCVLLAWQRNWRSIGVWRALVLTLLAGAIVAVVVGPLLFSGAHMGDLQVVGWDPGNAFRREVVNTDGAWQYPMPMGLFYLQPLVAPSYVFPLLAPLWLIGLRALGRLDAPVRVLSIGWPLVIYVFLAGIAWQNPRFSLALFPSLAVWVGLGFEALWIDRTRWRRWLAMLVALSIAGAGAWSLRVTSNFVAAKNLDLARVQHAVDRLPAGARLIDFGLTLALRHYTAFDVIEIYTESPDSLADLVCGRETYAYLSVGDLEGQWRGLPPDVNYRWLRDEARLEELDRFEGFTLFRARGGCG